MINKNLKRTNVIDGNFLTSRNLFFLYEIIEKHTLKNNDYNNIYFIIERINSTRFSIFVLCDDVKFPFNDKKEVWAINTIWYWLIGFYILNITNRELTTKELKNLGFGEIKLKINCNSLFKMFENIEKENISCFHVSQYIFKHKNDEGTFLKMLLNEEIGYDKTSFIYKLYHKYPYKEKMQNNITILDNKLKNFLDTLIDGITGKIKQKDNLIKIIESIHRELNKYKGVLNANDSILGHNKLNTYKSEIEIIKEKLIKILKKDFRKILIKSRQQEQGYINNDLYLNINNEKTIISSENPIWYVEATHIVPVENLVEEIIEKYINEPKNFGEDLYYDKKIEKYTDPKNGLLLPFNYRQFWHKNYFYFDTNGKICFDEKNRKLLESFKIDCNSRLNIQIDSEVKKLIQERNDVFNKI